MDKEWQDTINRLRPSRKVDKPQYQCDKCKDAKIIMVIDGKGDLVARDCDCAAKANALRYMRMSGISEIDLKKTISDYRHSMKQNLRQPKLQHIHI